MQYILLISSILLYLYSPHTYDYSICIGAFAIFVIGAVLGFIKLRKIEFFGFNLLFSISFFGCCYIFPIFIYDIDDTFSLFHHGYDYRVMTRATCLASIAYTSYLCGLLYKIKSVICYKTKFPNEKVQIIDSSINPNSVANISIAFFVLFIFLGGYDYLSNMYLGHANAGGLVAYAYVLISLIPILFSYVFNCSFSKRNIIICIAFFLLFLTAGSRTYPLGLLLGFFYIYTLQHKVPKYIILLLLIVGILAMSLLGATRGGQELESESTVGFWQFFLDLIVNNRNLFDSYSLVQNKGFVPTVLLGPILAVIPMSQTFFCLLTGTPSSEMTSAMYITIERLGPEPPIGLGTNIVGDIYLGGGFLLVLCLFYLLGYLISKSLYEVHIKKNIKWFIFYLTLVTNGIFICRGSFFLILRPFIWTLFIMYIVKKCKTGKNENIICK